MSIARWNLKEAAGKALARRTEIAYEACKLDEKAHIFKVRYLYGKLVVICGGHKREGECALPGEICQLVTYYHHREVMRKRFNGDFLQAEMVKAFLSSTEYRNRFGN